jgi:hypothetical protein
MNRDPTSSDSDGGADRRSDLAPDARLRAALRHAPDHADLPPTAVSHTILAAAHAAARPQAVEAPAAPSFKLASTLRAWWHRLGAPRPVWAGATAVLLVSVLTLRLWVDEPVPPAAEVSAPAPATAPAAPPVQTPTAPAPVTPSPTAQAPQVVPPAAKAHAPRPLPGPTSTAAPAQRQEPSLNAAGDARHLAPEPATAPAQGSAGAIGERARPVSPAAAPPPTTAESRPAEPRPQLAVPAPSPAPATALATVPDSAGAAAPAPIARSAPALAAAKAPAPMRESARDPVSADATGHRAERMPDGLVGKAAAITEPPSLKAWLLAARSATDDPRWPLSPAQRRLLLALDELAGTRWRPGPIAAPDVETGPPPRALQQRGGGVSTLRQVPQGALWTEPDGRQWLAPLDDPARQALRQAW